MKYFANGMVFAVVYIVFMLPTYLLPWMGSNSTAINAVAVAGETWNPLFLMHLFCLALLVGITWLRGVHVNKAWLVIIPIVAAAFDLIPGFNWVPFVPTVMHIFALVKGVASSPESAAPPTEN